MHQLTVEQVLARGETNKLGISSRGEMTVVVTVARWRSLFKTRQLQLICFSSCNLFLPYLDLVMLYILMFYENKYVSVFMWDLWMFIC